MEEPMESGVGMENYESGMSLVGTLETPNAVLGGTKSTMSCTVMEHFQASEDLLERQVQDAHFLPDSDDSEIIARRRRRNDKMPDPLKQLIKSEFVDLLDYLEHEIPQSVHVLSFIKLLLKWKESKELKRKGMKYKILVNRDDCGDKYSVVVAYYGWKNEVKGSIYAPSRTGEKTFKEALLYSKYLPVYSTSCEWSLFPHGVASEFLAYWRMKHEDDAYVPQYTAYPVHLYWMPKTNVDLINFEAPHDIKIYELEEKHAKAINHHWARHHEGTEELVRHIIQNNITAGAYNYTGCLMGWAFQTHYGAISIPFTLPKYRNKGVGRSVLLLIAQSLAKENFDPHIFIYKDDYILRTFLKNSGFTFLNELHYFYVDPPETNLNFPTELYN